MITRAERDRLLLENMAFIVDASKRVKPRQMETCDAIQTGVLASLRALPKYDPSRSSITTFLYPRIRGELLEHFRRRHRQVKRDSSDLALPTIIDERAKERLTRVDEMDFAKAFLKVLSPRIQLIYILMMMGLSQAEVADELGVSESRISQMLIEKGKKGMIRL